MSQSERHITWIHISLALIAPILILLATGCEEDKPNPLNFGPEVNPADVEAAISTPLKGQNPTKIKIGEFVHFAETQRLNNRPEAEMVISDTGQTVVNRVETTDRVTLTMVQNKITYSGNESRKTSTETEIVLPKATTSAFEKAISETTVPKTAEEHINQVILKSDTALKTFAAVFAAEAGGRTSYHNLRVAVESVFSQNTALPALAPASMRSECISVGVQTRSASISLSATIASMLAVFAPFSLAIACAASGMASATATSLALGCAAALAPWILPMRPAPSSPIRIMLSSLAPGLRRGVVRSRHLRSCQRPCRAGSGARQGATSNASQRIHVPN